MIILYVTSLFFPHSSRRQGNLFAGKIAPMQTAFEGTGDRKEKAGGRDLKNRIWSRLCHVVWMWSTVTLIKALISFLWSSVSSSIIMYYLPHWSFVKIRKIKVKLIVSHHKYAYDFIFIMGLREDEAKKFTRDIKPSGTAPPLLLRKEPLVNMNSPGLIW